MTETTSEPVFIFGALNRSGTNFVADIIKLDSSYSGPLTIGEDYFVYYVDLLTQYIKNTSRHWGEEYSNDHSTHGELLMEFGSIMLKTLKKGLKCNVVTTTPRTRGIDHIFEMIPNAKVILVVRDGRDTVESFRRSFKEYKNFSDIVSLWNEGALKLINFYNLIKKTKYSDRVIFVKYEELHLGEGASLIDIVNFCGLNEEKVNFKTVNQLPIRGSSTNRGNTSADLNWKKVEKTEAFKPLKRWERWSWIDKKRFKNIAGKTLIELQYVKDNNW